MPGPRQIVPLRIPEEVPAPLAPTANVTYHGGDVLTAVEVVTIFWGSAWATAPHDALASDINEFFDWILQSSLMDLMAEYGTPRAPIGRGSRTETFPIPTPEPGRHLHDGPQRTVSDPDIQTQLRKWIGDGTVSATTANTLYFVYLPPNVVSHFDTSGSCTDYCGYHNVIKAAGANIYYAVEPYTTCPGCNYGTTLDTQTKVSSHELFEAVTDPALDGWYDDGTGEEIGDICNSDVQTLGGYRVQSEWSQARGACMLAPAIT